MNNRTTTQFCNVSRVSHLSATALEPCICLDWVIYCVCHAAVPVFIPVRKHTAKTILPCEPDLRLRCTVRADAAEEAAFTTRQSREQTVPKRPENPAHHILSVFPIATRYGGRYAATYKVQGSSVQSRKRDPTCRLGPHMSPRVTHHNHQVGLTQGFWREMGSNSSTALIHARWDAAAFFCQPPTDPGICFEMASQ
jgi:hypothetical protein